MQWIAVLIVAVVAVWLWISWFYGWFPFVASPSVPSANTAQTQEDILRSLAPTVSTTSDPSRTAAILKTLTPSKTATKESAADTAAILDSLTPKK